MITNKGKGIIARSLAGQVSSPFSYIAMGVGPKPEKPISITEKLSTEWLAGDVLGSGVWGYETDTKLVKVGDGVTTWSNLDYVASGIEYESLDFLNKTKLDFEAFRVPVSGSSVIYEGGKTKIILTATLPSAQRYEFSEIGVFSSEFNPILNTEPPRMIYTFSASEGWQFHSGESITDITYVGSVSDNSIDINNVPGNSEAVFLSADNSIFFTDNRKNQRMRVYQDALLIRGDMSTIDDTNDVWEATGNHIHVAGIPINLTKARYDDEFKLSFSLMNKMYADIIDQAGDSVYPADEVKLLIVFRESETSGEYAQIQLTITEGQQNVVNQVPNNTDFNHNGYYACTLQRKDLKTSTGFSWENITICQIFVDVTPHVPKNASDYYVAIDAIRFDSNNDNNPAYGMTAYSVVQNSAESTEIKESQTESQIEYKIVLEVG